MLIFFQPTIYSGINSDEPWNLTKCDAKFTEFFQR